MDVSGEVLVLARHLFGEVNDNVASIHNERAAVLQDLGRYAEAAAEYRHGLDQYVRLDVAQTMDAGITLNNLAGLEQARGDAASADALFRRSLAIRRATVGDDVPPVWIVEANLARLLVEEGQLQQARSLIAHARAGWARQVAVEHPRRLLAEAIWVQLLVAEGDLAGADQSLAAIKAQLQGNDIRVERRYLSVLAERQRKAGDAAAAAQTLQQLVGLYESQVGRDSVETAQQRVRLADAQAAAGQCRAAQEQARIAWTAVERELLPASTLRRRAQSLLAGSGCAAG